MVDESFRSLLTQLFGAVEGFLEAPRMDLLLSWD